MGEWEAMPKCIIKDSRPAVELRGFYMADEAN